MLHNCKNNKIGPCVTFFGIKEKFCDSSAVVCICLHLSSDSSTLAYTRLVAHLHSSAFVYIRLRLVFTRLRTSSDSSVSLE